MPGEAGDGMETDSAAERRRLACTAIEEPQLKTKRTPTAEHPQNFANRTVWTGYNLDVLRGLNSENVDLIYMDPPFDSCSCR